MKSKTIICFLSLLLISKFCFSQEKKVESVEKSQLGDTKNVHKAGNLFFTGQFNSEDLKEISKAEVRRIISLRTKGEIDWDEKAAVEAEGIKFINIPFRTPETLTDDVFDKIRGLMKDKSEKSLFHCGMASRVGAVWLPYRVLDEGVDLETALKEAKEIGLKSAPIQKKAVDYIKRQQEAAKKKSVK